MLKYKANETLSGDVNGSNKVFVSANYIALVDKIVVDGITLIEADYSIDRYTITLGVAPTSTISLNHFYREELDIQGEGLVEFGAITQEVYDELGRNNLSKVYGKSRVESMINKSLKRLLNKAPSKSKIQHYALKGMNGMVVDYVTSTSISGPNIQGIDTQGAMLVGDNIYLPYTDYNGSVFTTQLQDLVEAGDRVIVGHRIPYGVQKISELYVDSNELIYVDSRDFHMNGLGTYTIIKGKDGSEYIFLPYSDKAYTLSVKYIPDQAIFVNETDIVDIPYEYTTTIVYDVCYRLAASREDERANYWYRELYGDGARNPGLLKEWKTYIAKQVKRNRGQIGFASTYKSSPIRATDEIPNGLY